MSSKRAVRRKQCTGKVRHENAQDAARHIFTLNRSKGYQGPMNSYKCKFCGGYHVGHRP